MYMKYLKKSIYLFAILSGVLLFTGCGRQGCTSSDGINFDPEAKNDDGTCIFPSDVFAGVYAYNDTIVRRYNNFPDSVNTLYKSDTFILYLLENKLVSWKQYTECNDTIKCSVTATNLDIETGYNCNGLWDNFTMVRLGNSLVYNYRIGVGGLTTDEIRGVATKQP